MSFKSDQHGRKKEQTEPKKQSIPLNGAGEGDLEARTPKFPHQILHPITRSEDTAASEAESPKR